jgi:hypothetical protein
MAGILADICNEIVVNDLKQPDSDESAVNDHGIETCNAPHDNLKQQESFFCCRRCLSGTYIATSGDPASDNTSGAFDFSFTFNYDGSGSFIKSEVGFQNSDLSNEYKGQWSVGDDGIVTLSASNELFHFKICCDNKMKLMPVTFGLFGCPAVILQKTVVIVPKLYQSISISNMFKLIDHIKTEVDAETMQTIIGLHKRGNLCQNSIDSDFLKIYFEQKKIYPPHEYESYFMEDAARAVLSYQWILDFRKIKAFLCARNLREHNLSVPLHPLKDFVSVFLFGWLWCKRHSDSLDENTNIWIDILFNNQLQKRNFPAILEKADYEYSSRPIHIALSTDQLLSRVWIINEFAKRREAGKYSTLVVAGGSEGRRIQQLQREQKIVMWRRRHIIEDYYENLQATVEEDRIQIREKLLKLYGTKDKFNRKIRSLVSSINSALNFYLWVWPWAAFIFLIGLLKSFGLLEKENSEVGLMNSTFPNVSFTNVSMQSLNETEVGSDLHSTVLAQRLLLLSITLTSPSFRFLFGICYIVARYSSWFCLFNSSTSHQFDWSCCRSWWEGSPSD